MQKDNTKVWPALIILLWAVLLLQQAHAQNLAFDLQTATQARYGTFLQNLRNRVSIPRVLYAGIPVMRPPPTPANYHLVDLQAIKDGARISMTLAINQSNLYVVAYTDRAGGRLRAHYFPDITNATASRIFPTADPIPIRYRSNYIDLEPKAGAKRENFKLGFDNFRRYMLNAYGINVSREERTQARFLLIALQMVPEAARFKYVERKALPPRNAELPDYKVPNLQNNWDQISRSIRRAVNSTTSPNVISPPLPLRFPNNSVWTVTRVDQISADMGLLSYVA